MFLCREFSSQKNTLNEKGQYKCTGGILKAKRHLRKPALVLAASFQTSVKMSASPKERGFTVPRKNPDCCAGSSLLFVSVEELGAGSQDVTRWETQTGPEARHSVLHGNRVSNRIPYFLVLFYHRILPLLVSFLDISKRKYKQGSKN